MVLENFIPRIKVADDVSKIHETLDERKIAQADRATFLNTIIAGGKTGAITTNKNGKKDVWIRKETKDGTMKGVDAMKPNAEIKVLKAEYKQDAADGIEKLYYFCEVNNSATVNGGKKGTDKGWIYAGYVKMDIPAPELAPAPAPAPAKEGKSEAKAKEEPEAKAKSETKTDKKEEGPAPEEPIVEWAPGTPGYVFVNGVLFDVTDIPSGTKVEVEIDQKNIEFIVPDLVPETKQVPTLIEPAPVTVKESSLITGLTSTLDALNSLNKDKILKFVKENPDLMASKSGYQIPLSTCKIKNNQLITQELLPENIKSIKLEDGQLMIECTILNLTFINKE